MPAACETNKRNLGNHIVCKDIRHVSAREIPKGSGYIYLIGASCRGFSNSNMKTSFLENPDNELTYDWINKVKHNKPDIIISENVPQILTKFNGAFAQEIIDNLSDVYHIEVKVLNAADYGVAQDRKRCIMIGSRIGAIKHPEPTHKTWKTVGEALEGLHDGVPNQTNIRKSSSEVIQRFKQVPQGGNWRNIGEFAGKDKHSILYRRLTFDET
jgi:DNA (cytosine-5)-methyltransferase 1